MERLTQDIDAMGFEVKTDYATGWKLDVKIKEG